MGFVENGLESIQVNIITNVEQFPSLKIAQDFVAPYPARWLSFCWNH
jgi:hypothetical protein